jgi:hypothetical protein
MQTRLSRRETRAEQCDCCHPLATLSLANMKSDKWLHAVEIAAFRDQTERKSQKTREGGQKMNWFPVIWSVWGATVVLMAVVSLYVSRLGKNEEDQLFLADSSRHEQTEQMAIAGRLEKVQPLKRASLWLVGAMTAVVVVYYVMDMIHQLR